MGSMKVDEVSVGATKQSRREALKRFGRYAAAAPAAMVLLEPRASQAGRGLGRGVGFGRGWGFGRGGNQGRGRGKGGHSHY
jgi:hypothetical protein